VQQIITELSVAVMQGLHIDVTLLSVKHLQPHERFIIPNYHFYQTDCFLGRKSRTAENAFPITL
jgi:hypothetical protein